MDFAPYPDDHTAMSNDPNWPPSHEQLPKNMSNTTNDPEQKYGEREPHEKPKLDLKFNPDGTHVHTIIQYVKKCGAAAYHKLMKDAADGEPLWTTGADMDAAEAILWLEAYYKNELKKQADLIADGTLIRRDELVKFLNERLLDEEKGVRWNMHNDGSAVTVVQNIIDHLNKKPA